MKTSVNGLIDIIQSEGIVLSRYLDAVNVWTIGVGHTKMAGDPDPALITGMITLEKALEIFQRDMKRYEAAVARYAVPYGLKQYEFDALVSFCFNVGEGNLRKLVEGRTKAGIERAILLYNKGRNPKTGNLEVLAGLTTRRKHEQTLFSTGAYRVRNGMVPVIPVNSANRPVYSKAKLVDIRKYFTPSIEEIVPEVEVATNWLVALIRAILGLFRR
jgi:lysozyme